MDTLSDRKKILCIHQAISFPLWLYRKTPLSNSELSLRSLWLNSGHLKMDMNCIYQFCTLKFPCNIPCFFQTDDTRIALTSRANNDRLEHWRHLVSWSNAWSRVIFSFSPSNTRAVWWGSNMFSLQTTLKCLILSDTEAFIKYPNMIPNRSHVDSDLLLL